MNNTATSSMQAYIEALALAYVQKRQDEYNDEVADWYDNGDGRAPEWVTEEVTTAYKETPEGLVDTGVEQTIGFRNVNYGGMGHTFPHCIHGVSRWVDYDCACGACEESLTIEEEAESLAADTLHKYDTRSAWLRDAPGDLPGDVRETLTEWVFDPIYRLLPAKEA